MSGRFSAGFFAELDAMLQQALDLDARELQDYLDRIDAESPRHAAHLRAMLQGTESDDELLADILDQHLWAGIADDPAAGQQFGPWCALGTIAHGGMARVLFAERASGGFEQFAAIKCLWPGLATPELIARFEQERQILARLDDPRIARLLDGGVRADGMPWLALEYVAGCALDQHCNQQRLSINARIALWDEVAMAVASAHRRLIVHRDLKPSNVLVNGQGAIKLLDFGIAKLLDADGFPSAAPPTRFEGRALTREFASPEQLREDSITTASDVYQLGLLLHALVCGVRPFRAGKRREADDEAMAPSIALRHDPDAEMHATQRASTSARLARRLRGDLDAIVLRALAVSPLDRYGSVDAMREDMERWQQGTPVRARRIGRLRRSGKWLRRHAWFATGCAVLIGLALTHGVTSIEQTQAIEREAALNRGVRNYLVGWFQAADPGGAQASDPRAREMLLDGLARVHRDRTVEPLLKAEMLNIIGEIHLARGELVEAESPIREANRLYQELPALDARFREASTNNLGILLHYTAKYAEAEALYREALDRGIATMGEKAFWTISMRQRFADVLHSRGRYDEAVEQLNLALEDALEILDQSDAYIAVLQSGLANVDRDRGKQRESAKRYAMVLQVQLAALGEGHPNTASSQLGWGRLLLDQGRIDEAAVQVDAAFATFRATRGQSTSSTAYCERVVAQLEEARGEFDAAAQRLQRLNELMRQQLPENHIIIGYQELDSGFVELSRGNFQTASEKFAIAQGIFDAIQPEGHPRRIEIGIGQALLAQRVGNTTEAERLLSAAREQAERQLAPEHPLFMALDLAQVRPGTKPGQQPGLVVLRVMRGLSRR